MAQRAAARPRPRAAARPVARKRAPARRAAPARAVRRGSRAKNGTLFFIIGTALFVAALPLCLLFAVGMAPAIVAGIVDRHPKRYLLRTVGVLNLSGMVLPVAALIHAGINVAGAATVLFDPYKWLWMYGAASLGWLCYLGTPPIARYVVEERAKKLEQDLGKRAQTLVEEWGEEVTGRKPQES
jgi:hypothetical protein